MELEDDFQKPTVIASTVNLLSNLGNAILTGISFIILVSLANLDQLGIYTGMMFVAELGALIAVMGINETATWRIASLYGKQQEDRVSPEIRGFFVTTIVISSIVSVCIILSFQLINDVLLKSNMGFSILTVIAIAILFHSLGTTASGVLAGHHKIELYSLVSFLSTLVGQVCGLVLFYLFNEILALALGWFFSGLIKFLAVAFTRFGKSGSSFIKAPSSTIAHYSIGIVTGHVLLFFSRWTDRYLLLLFASQNDVGIYSLPAKFWTFATFIPLALYLSLIPKLTKANEEKKDKEFERILRDGMSILLILLISLTVLVLPLSGPVITYIGGQEYSPGILVLQILYLGVPFYGVSFILGGVLKALGKSSMSAVCLLVGVVFGFLIGFLLIPIIGIIGAAVANTFTQVLSSLLALAFVKRRIKTWVDSRAISLLIVSSIPSLILLLLITNYLIGGLIRISGYIIAIGLEIFLWRKLDIIHPEWIELFEPILPKRIVDLVRRILIRDS